MTVSEPSYENSFLLYDSWRAMYVKHLSYIDVLHRLVKRLSISIRLNINRYSYYDSVVSIAGFVAHSNVSGVIGRGQPVMYAVQYNIVRIRQVRGINSLADLVYFHKYPHYLSLLTMFIQAVM